LRLMATHDWPATLDQYSAVIDEPALLHTIQYQPVAVFFSAIRKPDQAVALVRRALDVDRGNLDTRLMLGDFLQQAKHPKEALQVYSDIIAEGQADWRPWFGRADVYKEQRDFPGAAEARRKAHGLKGELDAVRTFTDVTT